MPQYETEAGYAIDRRQLRVRLDRMTRNAVMVDRDPNARWLWRSIEEDAADIAHQAGAIRRSIERFEALEKEGTDVQP